MKKLNGFGYANGERVRGGGTYVCDDCGKRTRDTHNGEKDCGLCYQCFTIAGCVNGLSDNYGIDDSASFEEKAHGLKNADEVLKLYNNLCGILEQGGLSFTKDQYESALK